MSRTTKFFPFNGGENLVDPVINMEPGELHDSYNYENSTNGGYKRIGGFERFDGQTRPSDILKSAYGDIDDWIVAVEAARALIQPLPGSGAVRGVWSFNGDVYGFRDNAGGTNCVMYKATASGWSEVYATFPAGGKYEFINYNFYGSSGLEEMYGINGVGQGFKFDGTTLTLISTTMAVDIPTHLFAFKKHLFFSFAGGSVQNSSIGVPTTWSPITGANEIAVGDEVTGFANAPQDAMVIFSRNSTNILYGDSSYDWNLTSFSKSSGAIPDSVQDINQPVYLDDRGVKTLTTTSSFGDFNMATLSQKVKPALTEYTNRLNCTLRVREKDQYRMMFDDGTVLIFAFNGTKVIGITKANYGYYDNYDFIPKIFSVAASAEEGDGTEILLVGDEDGYVYLMDQGNSFDGKEIEAYIRPVFYHFGSPERNKRFMKISLEIDAEQSFSLSFLSEFSYGDPYYPVAAEDSITVTSGSGIWDESIWENFYWDSQSLSTAYGYLTGIGKTFRLVIKSTGIYEEPHTIQGAIIHYSVKGYVK